LYLPRSRPYSFPVHDSIGSDVGGDLGRMLVALLALVLVSAGSCCPASAWEEEDFYGKTRVAYVARPGTSVIGKLSARRVQKGDTLFDIARAYSLGYGEIVQGNPGLDVWLPPPGGIALLPTEWVLPCCKRSGIVINIPEMRLYYFRAVAGEPGATEVVTYPVGLGREEWQTPTGKFKVRSKTVNPTWVIPESIRNERITKDGDDRKSIPGGSPENPLGAHRLALSLPGYAIHGTNIPWGVGMQVSHGCIRLYPEDVEWIFPLVPVGTQGEFVYQLVKIGTRGDDVYAEVAHDIYGLKPAVWKEAMEMAARLGVEDRLDEERLRAAIERPTGIPVIVSRLPDASSLTVVDATDGETHDGRAARSNGQATRVN